MHSKGIQFEVFHIWAKMSNKNYIFGYLGAPEGSSIIRLGLSCYPAISSHPYLCTCQIRKQSDKKIKFKPKIWKKYTFTLNPVERKRTRRTRLHFSTSFFYFYKYSQWYFICTFTDLKNSMILLRYFFNFFSNS